jgi:hypothetical protein
MFQKYFSLFQKPKYKIWKTMILLIVAYGYQTCFLDSEKVLDVREVCSNKVPSILSPNKEEKQENILHFNRQIWPQAFPCAQFPIYNSLYIIPVDVTIQATDRVVKQAIKMSYVILHYIRSWRLIKGK